MQGVSGEETISALFAAPEAREKPRPIPAGESNAVIWQEEGINELIKRGGSLKSSVRTARSSERRGYPGVLLPLFQIGPTQDIFFKHNPVLSLTPNQDYQPDIAIDRDNLSTE